MRLRIRQYRCFCTITGQLRNKFTIMAIWAIFMWSFCVKNVTLGVFSPYFIHDYALIWYLSYTTQAIVLTIVWVKCIESFQNQFQSFRSKKRANSISWSEDYFFFSQRKCVCGCVPLFLTFIIYVLCMFVRVFPQTVYNKFLVCSFWFRWFFFHLVLLFLS